MPTIQSISMTAVAHPSIFSPPRQFANGAEWLAALGDVPLDRVVFDPWPGTATEADLLRLIDRDKRLCELIDGTLVEKPVGYWEGIIAINLAAMLVAHVHKDDLGAISGPDSTMRMKSGRVRLPDVGFVSKQRLPKNLEPIPSLSPDLAIEVLSDSNTPMEIKQKLSEYFQSGTRLAWIVDPRTRSVAVYDDPARPPIIVAEHAYLDGAAVLPGLSIAVVDIFRNVPRLD